MLVIAYLLSGCLSLPKSYVSIIAKEKKYYNVFLDWEFQAIPLVTGASTEIVIERIAKHCHCSETL